MRAREKLILFAVACVPALLAALGCGDGAGGGVKPPAARGSAAGRTAPPPAVSKAAAMLRGAGGYEAVPVKDAGALRVSVVYAAQAVPEPAEVPVGTDVPFCGHKVLTEELLVDKETHGLKNVILRLEGIAKGKAGPETIVVTNRGCAFHPHVSVSVKGARLDVRNEDPIAHVTHLALNKLDLFTVALAAAGADAPPPRPIPQAGLVEIRCDLHRWMRAYMLVHTNPYAGVTDERGALEIAEIPAGRHAFTAWHEQLGEKKGEVEVLAGQTAELRLEFAPPR